MSATLLTDAGLESQVLRATVPVLIEFFTPRSPLAEATAQLSDRLAEAFQGRAQVYRLNVAESPMTAQAFQIRGIPTYALVHQGRIVDVLQGQEVSEAALVEQLTALAGAPSAASPIRKLATKEAAGLLQQRRLQAVDLRSQAEFDRVHLPGAIAAPEETRSEVLAEWRERAALLLYDRTGTDTEAIAKELGDAGYTIAWLEGGLLAWEADGFPIERGVPAWMR